MIHEPCTYTDFNGIERTENFYFHLSESEIMKMELAREGGLAENIKKIVDAKDAPAIMRVFDDLLLKSYGVKSDDGRFFLKTKPDGSRYADDFKQSPAYDIIFMKLATDADAAGRFVNGIVPEKLRGKMGALPNASAAV